MSGKKPILLNQTTGGLYFIPMAKDGPSPVVKAFAAAVKEVRRKTGKAPVYFSHEPKGTPQNPEGETK
jgi:hypothetical protein